MLQVICSNGTQCESSWIVKENCKVYLDNPDTPVPCLFPCGPIANCNTVIIEGLR